MIDFRYHVVSIVAIFLALTVGLVIGASILSQGIADSLRGNLARSNAQISSQQSQIKQLESQLAEQSKYISSTAAGLVAHQLDAGCVAVLQLPGADANAFNASFTMIQKQSGATICSETTINASFTADGSQAQLAGLIAAHLPTGQTLTGGTEQQKAAELLAEALTTIQPGGSTTGQLSPQPTGKASPAFTASPSATGTPGAGTGLMTAGEALSTLKDFQTDGLITMVVPPVEWGQPNLAYLAAPSTANSDAENQVFLALAQALRHGGALPVVGGSGQSADKGGLIDAVIADSTAARDIPTVDDTDTTMGQVASVFCLAGLLQNGSGAVGHYGTGPNNDGPIPPNLAALGSGS